MVKIKASRFYGYSRSDLRAAKIKSFGRGVILTRQERYFFGQSDYRLPRRASSVERWNRRLYLRNIPEQHRPDWFSVKYSRFSASRFMGNCREKKISGYKKKR